MKNFEAIGHAPTEIPSKEQLRAEFFETLGVVEREKTLREKEIIQLIAEFLAVELKELGIEEDPDENQWHFIADDTLETFNEAGITPETSGACDPFGNIYIFERSEHENEIELVHNMLHEAVHAAAVHKVFYTENNQIAPYRAGYSVNDAPRAKERIDNIFFDGLDEAITEQITLYILFKNKQNLLGKGIEGDIDAHIYIEQRKIITRILSEIAKKTGIHINEAWKNLKKGYFTGEMMHLRIIEKIFGKKSLRILAMVQSFPANEEGKFLQQKIDNFFKLETEQEQREILAKEILEHSKRNSDGSL